MFGSWFFWGKGLIVLYQIPTSSVLEDNDLYHDIDFALVDVLEKQHHKNFCSSGSF